MLSQSIALDEFGDLCLLKNLIINLFQVEGGKGTFTWAYFCQKMEKKASVFLSFSFCCSWKHWNQLHALTSPLSESDQTTSLQCTKELGSKMQLSDSIACTLCVTCSEMQEFHKQHTWVVYNDEPRDQCPV
ncbi:hypothetical protein CMV_018129 [Castanea mollissima]|uniref:Uncharacterized protein n=1 Tax=Castanea mollissima TaxID=60419 RepID=A0A8J4R3V3_9ROSI|nr:hypothetical protein CMV_018129 [Castanea mollissima]